jgi:four helix bundle protein
VSAGRVYDLEDRLIEFAVLVCKIAETFPSSRVGKHVAGQLMRCGTAPAPNYGEAQSGESRKDFIHKMKVCLKRAQGDIRLAEVCEMVGYR